MIMKQLESLNVDVSRFTEDWNGYKERKETVVVNTSLQNESTEGLETKFALLNNEIVKL
jgi:hypothetical protein